MDAHSVLVEPIYGCWEANMAHALARRPIDVCHERGEDRVVLGNAGVVRVVEAGAAVATARPGDVCLLFGNGVWDESGYMMKALAYDAPNTMGALARQAVVHERNVIPLPRGTRFSLKRWAAFSLRYVTAWANWRVAYGCWKVQMSDEDVPSAHVWGWGGGSTLGELLLAQQHGFQAAMIASTDERLAQIAQLGLTPIDRRAFAELAYDEERFGTDREYRARYLAAEQTFLNAVRERTDGRGVSVFVDYIGTPVARATVKALARQGVLTTAGWKHGMTTRTVRAVECIQRHVHVHTHFARYSEARAAVQSAEATGWLPPVDDAPVYPWSEIPALAADYAAGRVKDYFPLYQVNAM
jgi:NADPH:quinone reductase-like Zn-dependent oxidoreductase